MPSGTPSRSDDALRDLESRPAQVQSDLSALCALVGKTDRFNDDTAHEDAHRTFKGFRDINRAAYATLTETHLQLLRAVPGEPGRDIVILAGHAALMADQISDMDVRNNVYAARLLDGIHRALVTLSGALASRAPDEVAEIGALWPELGRSIRCDVAAVAALRADTEGC